MGPLDQPQTIESQDVADALMIVVGAHLRAEAADRPLAYGLQEEIRRWLAAHAGEINVTVEPVVCSDIWYVNQEALQLRPTVSIGGPGVNAVSAYYANRLPRAVVRDDQATIQLDTEFIDLRVCVWGVDHASTRDALARFQDKYLDGYLRAVVTQVEPDEG